jgi:hypothetical protein
MAKIIDISTGRRADVVQLPLDETAAYRRARRNPRLKIDGLSDLLVKRSDLRGTYAPADFMDDLIRWSA